MNDEPQTVVRVDVLESEAALDDAMATAALVSLGDSNTGRAHH